jgi:hypothetical protein
MTRRDVLEGNRDLIDLAIAELAARDSYPTRITIEPRPGRPPLVVVHATRVTRIDARLDIPTDDGTERRWFASQRVRHGRVELDPEEILDSGTSGSVRLEVNGRNGDKLVTRLQETLELG